MLVPGTTWVATATWLPHYGDGRSRRVAPHRGPGQRVGESDAAQTDEADRAPADGTDAPVRAGAMTREDAAGRF